MTFTHPLARTSRVGSTAGLKGKVRRVLVIITGLQLDKDHKKYDEQQVNSLSEAAKGWLDEHPQEATDFMLMNRPKTWLAGKG